MRRPLLAAAVALSLAVGAPASATDPTDSRSVGGCRYEVVGNHDWQVGQPYRFTAVVGAAAALYAELDPTRPVSATLTCYFSIDGVPDDDVVTFAGTGVVTGVAHVDYVLTDGQILQFCEHFDFADDTPKRSRCYPTGHGITVPPQAVEDLLPDAPRLGRAADRGRR